MLEENLALKELKENYHSLVPNPINKDVVVISKTDKDYTWYSKILMHEPEGDDFLYRYNKLNFRSKSFDDLDSEFALFAGCSVSFGQGIPEEYSWPYLVSKRIDSDFANISSLGADAVTIVNNVISFIETIKTPRTVMILFPQINRHRYIGGRDKTIHHSSPISPSSVNDIYEWANQENNILKIWDNINIIRLLEVYCKNRSIELLWTSWDAETTKFYELFKFNNFIGHIGPNNNFKINKESNLIVEKYWEWGRDLSHPGVEMHQAYASTFYNKYQGVV